MSKGDNRLKVLYIIDELKNKSDDNHYIKTSELIAALNEKDLNADRKSVYSYVESLMDYGMNIEKSKLGYKLLSRDFELAELKMLVDALSASRFIPAKKTQDIIKKLESMTSEYNRTQLNRQVYIENAVKSDNWSVIYSIDAIHNAISTNKQISFNYLNTVLDFCSEEKIQRVYRTDEKGEPKIYRQSPYALLWKNENYYMLSFDSDLCRKKTFRVDRMVNVDILKAKREGAKYFLKFDTAKYANTAFSMFGGENADIVLRVKNDLAGVIIDRFGNDIGIYKDDNEHFLCTVNIQKSKMFFSWISGFGDGIELKSPRSIRKEYTDYLRSLLDIYKNDE